MSAFLDIPLKLINSENRVVRYLSFLVIVIIAVFWLGMKYSNLQANMFDHEKRLTQVEQTMKSISQMQQSLSNIEGYLKGRDSR